MGRVVEGVGFFWGRGIVHLLLVPLCKDMSGLGSHRRRGR
jgi:hypothetical protein